MKHAARGAYGKIRTKPNTLGQRICLVRMTWKWSQTRLAEALGTNQQTVSHWEQERQQPTDATLHAVASLFGMNAEALMTGKGFFIPDPPQNVGNLLIAANIATDLVKLPSPCKGQIVLVTRGEESVKLLSPQSAMELVRRAGEDERAVWIVV